MKVWEWLKKNWKWIVFPVGILLAVLGWFFWWRGRQKVEIPPSTTDDAADNAVDATAKASDVKTQALEELEKDHGEKLSTMTDEQRDEFEKVKKKPIDEVVEWIDNL